MMYGILEPIYLSLPFTALASNARGFPTGHAEIKTCLAAQTGSIAVAAAAEP